MDLSQSELDLLFEYDQARAMDTVERVLWEGKYDSFQHLVTDVAKKNTNHRCMREWHTPTLAVSCANCILDKQSCVCIYCYLKGNHKNHRITISETELGNCDCGDSHLWKKEGFCCDHSGNPTNTDISDEIQQFLINAFASSFKHASFLASHQPVIYSKLINWLLQIAKIDETYQICIIKAIAERNDLDAFLSSFHVFQMQCATETISFFLSLFNNQYGTLKLSIALIQFFPKFVWMLLSVANDLSVKNTKHPFGQLGQLINIFFLAFNQTSVKEVLLNGIRWRPVLTEAITQVINFFYISWNLKLYDRSHVEQYFVAINDMLDYLIADKEQFDEVNTFTSDIFRVMLKIEGIKAFQRAFGDKENDENEESTTMHRMQFVLGFFTQHLACAPNIDINPCFSCVYSFVKKSFIEDTFDLEIAKKSNVCTRSTLSPGVSCSSSMMLHIALGRMLSLYKGDINDLFRLYYDPDAHNSYDEFCMYFTLLPLRFFACYYQVNFHFFARNAQALISATQNFTFKGNIELRLMPVFALVQIIIGNIQDKNMASLTILSIFGCLLPDHEERALHSLLFSYVTFIANLVTDRACFNYDLGQFVKQSMCSALQDKKMSSAEINGLFWQRLIDDPVYQEVLQEIAERDNGVSGSKYKLKSTARYTPIAPWVSPPALFRAISTHIQQKPNSLLPFPEYHLDGHLLNLKGLLTSSATFAVIYYILSANKNDKKVNVIPSLHITLNLLLLAHSTQDSTQEQEPYNSDTSIQTLSDLIAVFPSSFEAMMKSEFVFRDRPKESMYVLIESTGKIGYDVLVKMGYIVENVSLDEEDEQKKAKAKAAKLRISSQFKQNTFAFNDDDFEEEEEEIECSLCHQHKQGDEVFWFPMTLYLSNLSSFDEYDDQIPSDFAAHICNHLVHESCVKNPKRIYYCAVDRSIKNCLLPKLPEVFNSELSRQLAQTLKRFEDIFSVHLVSNNNVLKALISLFISTVKTVELRDRSNHNFSTKQNNVLLIRYLFRCLWYMNRIHLNNTTEYNNEFWNFVIELINSDQPDADHQQLVEKFSKGIQDKDFLKFIRMASLIKSCAFDSHPTDLPSIKTTNLNVFPSIKLPIEFLRFALPEYGGFPIEKYDQRIGLCLKTGKVVLLQDNNSKNSSEFLLVGDHVSQNCGGFGVILVLSGPESSIIKLYVDTFDITINMGSIYVDKYGDEDPGFAIGHEIYLNTELLDTILDMVYSGEWIWKIKEGDVVNSDTDDSSGDEYQG